MGLAIGVAIVLSLGTAYAVDHLAARRGFDPPGFRDPLRRLLAMLILSFVFFLAVFLPATTFSQAPEIDVESLSALEIFFSPLLLLVGLAIWYCLGFVAVDSHSGSRFKGAWRRHFGLPSGNIVGEMALGLAIGLAAWFAVLLAALVLGFLLTRIGGDSLVAQEPAELIVWMAGLPVLLRLLISLSAGVVEEIFFRGFLQPRLGIALSTLLFVAAHLGYGQPLMLFGITLLSLIYAWLVRWRGSVWAAISAHFLFDAVQLLVIIPAVLRVYDTGALGPVAPGP